MVGAHDPAAVAVRLLAVLVVAATLPVLSTAWAQYPALDPARGVMTLAPPLDRAAPAVVNISVASGVPAAENPRSFATPCARGTPAAVSAAPGIQGGA